MEGRHEGIGTYCFASAAHLHWLGFNSDELHEFRNGILEKNLVPQGDLMDSGGFEGSCECRSGQGFMRFSSDACRSEQEW